MWPFLLSLLLGLMSACSTTKNLPEGDESLEEIIEILNLADQLKYEKKYGIETALRCMGPSVIAVDEITAAEDCEALIHAGWCGVRLFATAHASCKADLYARPVYKPLTETHLFDTLITLGRDKSWHVERMDK